jgi:trans-2,3-dihydro-3-hydroxyanthranilate isomerase
MKEAEIQIVDSCCKEPFQGSPTGVVLDAKMLKDDVMQLIASEMHLPVTAFNLGGNDDNLHIRFFNPTSELQISAHGAVAMFTALALAEKLKPPKKLNMLTRIGKLEVEITPKENAPSEVAVTLPAPEYRDFGYSIDLLAGILGIDRYSIPTPRPMGLVNAGAWTLVVPITTKEELDEVHPDYDSLNRLNQKVGAVSMLLYSWQGPTDIVCRAFAPASSIPEDPVIGEAIAAAASLIVKEGAIGTTPPVTKIHATQGTNLGRPSQVTLEVNHDKEGINSIRLIATAEKTLEGKIRLP